MLPDAPVTRLETYLARLAGQDVSIPDTPITRTEEYLDYIIRNGGGVPAPNAGAHNSIFRGKNLGNTYTSAQADAIDSGTFDDLFVGDYWEMPWGEEETPVKFRIAGLDSYYGYGEPVFTSHHVVIIPDESLGLSEVGDVTHGYVGSKLRTEFIAGIIPALNSLFNSNILSRYTRLMDSISTLSWVEGSVEAISVAQVTQVIFNLRNTGERNIMLPLFRICPSFSVREYSYLSADIFSASSVLYIRRGGITDSIGLSATAGVRPYFCLGKAPTQ